MDNKHKLLGISEKVLKMFDENSIENCIFKNFWKILLQIAFGNNIIFLQQFFRFRGGVSRLPLATPLLGQKYTIKYEKH